MARTRSMTRNRNHNDDDDASSSSTKRPKSCASWSELNHDLVNIIMMKLGFGDYYSFRRVCKSWRSLAHSDEKRFMASRPPMSITISTDANEKTFLHLEDFQGRTFKTILPDFAAGVYVVGLTCGYLVFFIEETRDFLLVNPVTSKELHFPDYPYDYIPSREIGRAILVFSPSISGLVLVVLHDGEIMTSVPGKGTWNYVYLPGFHFYDLYAFKGKIYTVTYNFRCPLNERFCLCELRLNLQPKVSILEIKNPDLFYPHMFVSSGESLYVMRSGSEILNSLHELDLGKMKWVKPYEEKIVEYAFFSSVWNHVGVAVKRGSWADPRSLGGYASFPNTDHNGNIRFFFANLWYVPHESLNIDRID